MSETNSRYGIPADTNIGMPATRPPAQSSPPAQQTRARMIRFAGQYAAAARLHGFRHVAMICDIAADAVKALSEAQRRLAIAHQRIAELEHQLEVESFRAGEETKRRPADLDTQEIRRLHISGQFPKSGGNQ